MREASKTRAVRPADFYDAFVSGKVLDIGCGDDLCVPHAVPFEHTLGTPIFAAAEAQEQGDANDILKHFSPGTFDCVHSSHCLEHVIDPVRCLKEWWSLVKPGGFLVTVVPDEDFYEQGNWPSLFNPDHKSTFRLDGDLSWSPVSVCVPDLVASLPGAVLLSAKRQLDGYVGEKFLLSKRSSAGYMYRTPSRDSRLRSLKRKVCDQAGRWIIGAGLTDTPLERLFVHIALLTRSPMDQTLGKALAQIEVIAQKKHS